MQNVNPQNTENQISINQPELDFEDPLLWDTDDLTPRQLAFCNFYACSPKPNQTRSYLSAYYPDIDETHENWDSAYSTAKTEACKLMKNPHIKDRIRAFIKQINYQNQVQAGYVLENARQLIEIGMGRQKAPHMDQKGKIHETKVFDPKAATNGLKILISHISVSDQFSENIAIKDTTDIGSRMAAMRDKSENAQ